MFEVITVLFFGAMYALKGGSGGLFPWWSKLRSKNVVTERLLDGKVISSIFVFMFSFLFLNASLSGFNEQFGVPEYTTDIAGSVLMVAAWLLAVSPSMGNEHGAIGDHKEWWGLYSLKNFGRTYGIKKSIQRGAWMGLVFMLLTPYTMVGWTSLLFVPCVFIGQCLNKIVLKQSGWTLAEPIVGGLCIGLGIALS